MQISKIALLRRAKIVVFLRKKQSFIICHIIVFEKRDYHHVHKKKRSQYFARLLGTGPNDTPPLSLELLSVQILRFDFHGDKRHRFHLQKLDFDQLSAILPRHKY